VVRLLWRAFGGALGQDVADQGGGVPVADAVVGLEPVDEFLVLGQRR
jgi:hypothetical protein